MGYKGPLPLMVRSIVVVARRYAWRVFAHLTQPGVSIVKIDILSPFENTQASELASCIR